MVIDLKVTVEQLETDLLVSHFQARDYVDSFFNRCVRPFEQLIQTCGHNRARQRDKVAHLLEEFAMLQDEVSQSVEQ